MHRLMNCANYGAPHSADCGYTTMLCCTAAHRLTTRAVAHNSHTPRRLFMTNVGVLMKCRRLQCQNTAEGV